MVLSQQAASPAYWERRSVSAFLLYLDRSITSQETTRSSLFGWPTFTATLNTCFQRTHGRRGGGVLATPPADGRPIIPVGIGETEVMRHKSPTARQPSLAQKPAHMPAHTFSESRAMPARARACDWPRPAQHTIASTHAHVSKRERGGQHMRPQD